MKVESHSPQATVEIDIGPVLEAVWRQRGIALLVLLLAVFTGVVLAFARSPLYEAQAVIAIREHRAFMAQYASSAEAFTAVAERVGGVTVQQLEKVVLVEEGPQSSLIRIRARHPDPSIARKIVVVLTGLTLDRQRQLMARDRRLLEVNLRLVRQEIERSREALDVARATLREASDRSVRGGDGEERLRKLSAAVSRLSGATYADLLRLERMLQHDLLMLAEPSVIVPADRSLTLAGPSKLVIIALVATAGLPLAFFSALLTDRLRRSNISVRAQRS